MAPKNLTVNITYLPNGYLLLYEWMIDEEGFQDGFIIETCSLVIPQVCNNESHVYSEPLEFEASQKFNITKEDLVFLKEYLSFVYSYTKKLVVRGAQVMFTIGNYLPLLLV